MEMIDSENCIIFNYQKYKILMLQAAIDGWQATRGQSRPASKGAQGATAVAGQDGFLPGDGRGGQRG